jgi:acyl dehydratase
VNELLYFEDFPVGKTFGIGRTDISATQIDSYAAAFDPRPRANGGIQPAASPIQLCAILMRLNFDGWMSGTAARGAPGVDEVVWQQPAHAGQPLNGRARVLNARVSHSKPELGFVQFRYELIDDQGKLAIAQTNYVMFARRNADGVTERPTQKKKPETAAAQAEAAHAMPKEWNVHALGKRVATGTTHFTRDDIIAFARVYDPQSFHVDEVAAKSGPFGALAASGWHTASAWMNAYVRACDQSGLNPGRLLSMTDLRWLRPTYAGDTIAWDFTPIDIAPNGAAEAILTSRNSGANQDGVPVFEFTAKMALPTPK